MFLQHPYRQNVLVRICIAVVAAAGSAAATTWHLLIELRLL